MTILIYDSGRIYQLTVDPDNIPEWLSAGGEIRFIQADERM